jgi:hypothetical protein
MKVNILSVVTSNKFTLASVYNYVVKVIKKSLMSNTFSDVPQLDLIAMPTCRHAGMIILICFMWYPSDHSSTFCGSNSISTCLMHVGMAIKSSGGTSENVFDIKDFLITLTT